MPCGSLWQKLNVIFAIAALIAIVTYAGQPLVFGVLSRSSVAVSAQSPSAVQTWTSNSQKSSIAIHIYIFSSGGLVSPDC